MINGRRRLLIAGDYPYYRDRPERWGKKLRAMREGGLEVVTFYIPWRHHLVARDDESQRFVFEAATGADNRDLIGFLRLILEADLYAVVKPGPFIHGEVQFGGLPDFTSPTLDPSRTASISGEGRAEMSQNLMLPSALSEAFLGDASVWLGAVWERVIRDRMYPKGPILAIQLGNEGIYSNTNHPITAFDYAGPATEIFRRFLARRYGDIDSLNSSYRAEYRDFDGVEPARGWDDRAPIAAFLDRGAWAGWYLNEAFRLWGDSLGEAPKLVNIPPPARAEWQADRAPARYDAWLARVRPEGLPPGVHYGFSDWVGIAAEDDEAFLNCVVAAKRRRGPNLEQNWGLEWSERRCAHASCTVYQALLALACGATGYAVYPACATESWPASVQLDRSYLSSLDDPSLHEPPYGKEAPIDVDGGPATKFRAMKLLNAYLALEGEHLAGISPQVDVALGLYGPYSHLMAWQPPPDTRIMDLRPPQLAADVLKAFVQACLERTLDFNLTDLESIAESDLLRISRLVVPGGAFLSSSVQEKLARYVEAGGCLFYSWEVPGYDDRLQECNILRDRILSHARSGPEVLGPIEPAGITANYRPLSVPEGATILAWAVEGAVGYSVKRGRGRAFYLDPGLDDVSLGNLLADAGHGPCNPAATTGDRRPLIANFLAPAGDDGYQFILGRSRVPEVVETRFLGDRMEVALPRGGAFVYRASTSGGRPTLQSFYIKACNELHNENTSISIKYGDDHLSTGTACDLMAYRLAGRWHCSAERPGGGDVVVDTSR